MTKPSHKVHQSVWMTSVPVRVCVTENMWNNWKKKSTGRCCVKRTHWRSSNLSNVKDSNFRKHWTCPLMGLQTCSLNFTNFKIQGPNSIEYSCTHRFIFSWSHGTGTQFTSQFRCWSMAISWLSFISLTAEVWSCLASCSQSLKL